MYSDIPVKPRCDDATENVKLQNAASRFLWRRRLSACVRVRGAHSEHKF